MSPKAVAALLKEQTGLEIDVLLSQQLCSYLDLLLRWNARTNLTAIRRPEQIVVQHFGECLQCAQALPAGARSVLDYGSGAGFPGAVCALARPELAVVLAEAQGKKAAFLGELERSLRAGFVVHGGRVEDLPLGRVFDVVTLRAVDGMEGACRLALGRVAAGGVLCVLTTRAALKELSAGLVEVEWGESIPVRGTEQRVIVLGKPRLAGTAEL